MEDISGSERGYLRERFRLFHSVDQTELKVDWHFHSFDKLVFFRAGHTEYTVESRSYRLSPGDILAIGHGQLHKMHSRADRPYERYILYLNSGYLKALAPEAGGLNACFSRARAGGQCLIHPRDSERSDIQSLLTRMEKALRDPSPYTPALSQALLTELMILLCRMPDSAVSHPEAPSDEKIATALYYIQSHLGDDLSCDFLAGHLQMSRSSFQHRFKLATGRGPHAYIVMKRMIYAGELLGTGTAAMEAGRMCGYSDHSAFCEAFTRQFGVPPSGFIARNRLTGPEE